jgi:hypothetical protein
VSRGEGGGRKSKDDNQKGNAIGTKAVALQVEVGERRQRWESPHDVPHVVDRNVVDCAWGRVRVCVYARVRVRAHERMSTCGRECVCAPMSTFQSIAPEDGQSVRLRTLNPKP